MVAIDEVQIVASGESVGEVGMQCIFEGLDIAGDVRYLA
jgi:hypothetical protein